MTKKFIQVINRYKRAETLVDAFNKAKAVSFSIKIEARNIPPCEPDLGGPRINIVITEEKRQKRMRLLAPFPMAINPCVKRISEELSAFMKRL